MLNISDVTEALLHVGLLPDVRPRAAHAQVPTSLSLCPLSFRLLYLLRVSGLLWVNPLYVLQLAWRDDHRCTFLA